MENCYFWSHLQSCIGLWKSVPALSARGMAFQVSCGGCHVRGSGYKISLWEMAFLGGGLGGA